MEGARYVNDDQRPRLAIFQAIIFFTRADKSIRSINKWRGKEQTEGVDSSGHVESGKKIRWSHNQARVGVAEEYWHVKNSVSIIRVDMSIALPRGGVDRGAARNMGFGGLNLE
jgi:hypothetical protein